MRYQVTFGRRRTRVLGLLVLLLALVGWSADPAGGGTSHGLEVRPWTAAHGNGSASGTYEIVISGLLWKTITVDGELSSSAAGECYQAQLAVSRDLTVWFYDVATHCGRGSTPFVTSASGSLATSSFGIRLCQVVDGAVRDCGATTRLP